jgi:hypothetical protein
MLSKKARLLSLRITYSAIQVVIAHSLTFSVRAILLDIGQTGARIVAVVISVFTCSETTRYILSSSSLHTNQRTLEDAKKGNRKLRLSNL